MGKDVVNISYPRFGAGAERLHIKHRDRTVFYDPHHVSHGHDKTVMIQNIGIKFRNIAAAKQRMGKGMRKKHPHIFMKISRLAVTLTTAGMQLPEMMQKRGNGCETQRITHRKIHFRQRFRKRI